MKPIRILWLSIDHSRRVMDLYSAFRMAVGRVPGVDVEYRVRDLGEGVIAGQVCRRIWATHDPQPNPFEPMIADPRETDEFDFVMCDTAWLFHNEPWAGIKCPSGVSWGDNHGSMVPQYLDAARAHYDCFFPMLWESWEHFHADRFTDKHVWWLPWSFDPAMFYDRNEPKSIDVLSTGVLNNHVYPVRTNAAEACSSMVGYVRVERPPEATGRHGWPCGEDYARLVNRSKIALSCSGAWQYALGKTFEIPASNTVLASDLCQDARDLGHEAGETMIELSPAMDRAAMRAVLDDALADPAEMDRIAHNGFTLMHNNHTNDVRAAQFVAHLKDCVL